MAARITARWLRAGEFPDRQLAAVTQDRAFLTEVTYGIARWRGLLDWVIEQVASRPPDGAVLPFLYVGLYQLLLMDHVAPYAAVNETVNALKQDRKAARAAGFVNGLLRRVTREGTSLRAAIEAQPLHVRESHPRLLVDRWSQRFGEERTAALCRWNNTRPHVVVHPYAGRTTVAALSELFRARGIHASSHSAAPEAFLSVAHGVAVHEFPGYEDALFSVQDPSTYRAVEVLDPRPGETVLDACAAPGGKTVMIAERMAGRGRLVAADKSAGRMPRLRANLERMGLGWVEAVQVDLTSPRFGVDVAGAFDRILLDAPCTNSGVLRRRPDARWRFGITALKDAASLQSRMLACAASLLKPGGVLVYSTCSLEPEEGHDPAAELVENRPELAIEEYWTNVPPDGDMDGGSAIRIRRS